MALKSWQNSWKNRTKYSKVALCFFAWEDGCQLQTLKILPCEGVTCEFRRWQPAMYTSPKLYSQGKSICKLSKQAFPFSFHFFCALVAALCKIQASGNVFKYVVTNMVCIMSTCQNAVITQSLESMGKPQIFYLLIPDLWWMCFSLERYCLNLIVHLLHWIGRVLLKVQLSVL